MVGFYYGDLWKSLGDRVGMLYEGRPIDLEVCILRLEFAQVTAIIFPAVLLNC